MPMYESDQTILDDGRADSFVHGAMKGRGLEVPNQPQASQTCHRDFLLRTSIK